MTRRTHNIAPTRARRPLFALTALLLWLCSSTPVAAGEFEDFASAKNAFDAGNYPEAARRFTSLLEGPIQNPALRLEAHKLSGISYLFMDNEEKAEEHFFELLTRAPEMTLDPMLFPIEVIDFFDKVKQENDERIAELARTRREEAERRRLEEERSRQAEREKLKRNVYIQKDRKVHSRIISVMPFGAGQFQNKHKTKGFIYLGLQSFFLASTITTFALHAQLHREAEEPFASSSTREKFERRELGYRIANWVSLGGLVTTYVVGVVDALRHYTPETVTWNEVKESDVPTHLHGPAPNTQTSALRPFVRIGVGSVMFGGMF